MVQGWETEGLVSLDVVELVCSRLCHDLAGPLGAIRNGVELIKETGGEGGAGDDAQALELIEHSAEQAARRLRLFRLAYGRSTHDGMRSFTDLREAAQEWLAGSRVTLRWPPGQPDDGLAGRSGLGRMLLNLVILGTETIPQGGVIAVAGGGSLETGSAMAVITGRNLKRTTELEAALAGRLPREQLGPRTIHAVITGRFADNYRLALNWQVQDAETLVLRLTW